MSAVMQHTLTCDLPLQPLLEPKCGIGSGGEMLRSIRSDKLDVLSNAVAAVVASSTNANNEPSNALPTCWLAVHSFLTI
ncbi:hypothetical protein BofuT4_P038840.1 [Botrytis cinerea T4]|uniref:Uncharacterized protein n=1 Tax=Botryotinia fuckeliana (strain T4) TaxID=999810 RepID=G2Y2U2_BOTF4|nr:hypothetical protein BofuT4_P038840.1 [Botrytis cinerea T4]